MEIKIQYKEEKSEKLGKFLRSRGISASLINSLKYLPGGICVNGERAYTGRVLAKGDRVTLDTRLVQQKGKVSPERGNLEILYEDENYMVVNKPRGMACHPSFTRPCGTLANFFVGLWQDRGQDKICRILTRLDRPTSGAVLIALDKYAAAGTVVSKEYTAVVTGQFPFPRGAIYRPISLKEGSVIEREISPWGKPSATFYRRIKSGKNYTLLSVFPKTGRTHQIRVHFSYIGHPLAGDDLYGGKMADIGRVALHCRRVTFLSGGKEVRVEAPIPADIENLAEKIL